VVVNVLVDPAKQNPLDPLVKSASPADVALVVVGGQPLYGDPQLLAQVLPAGTKTDRLVVCGAEKAVYLGMTEAANRGWTLADITKHLTGALAKGGSTLPDIECN
jgi:hypothetical protein